MTCGNYNGLHITALKPGQCPPATAVAPENLPAAAPGRENGRGVASGNGRQSD